MTLLIELVVVVVIVVMVGLLVIVVIVVIVVKAVRVLKVVMVVMVRVGMERVVMVVDLLQSSAKISVLFKKRMMLASKNTLLFAIMLNN